MEIKQAKLLLLFFTFAAVCLHAQEAENTEPQSVAADRPGMATGVGVLPFKTIQWETGFQWDYADRRHAFTLPTTMLRFGVAPFAELRLEYDGTLYSDAKWQYQVEPLILGTKIRVFDGWTSCTTGWSMPLSIAKALLCTPMWDLA